MRDADARYYRTPNGLRKRYADKARRQGIEFSLTLEQVAASLEEPCAYCGGQAGGIDRVDPPRGYVTGNVLPCCWDCNRSKGTMQLNDWLDHLVKLSTRIPVIADLVSAQEGDR